MNEGNGKWRRSEFISIGTLLLLATWIFYAGAKVKDLDITVDVVKELKPKVEVNTVHIAAIDAKLDDIRDDLNYIKRHLR